MPTSPIAPAPLPGPAPHAASPRRPPDGEAPVAVRTASADRVSRMTAEATSDNPAMNFVDRAKDWAKDEWSTVATAGHLAASTPGMLARAFEEAAADNRHIADNMNGLRRHWSALTSAARDTSIANVEHAVGSSPSGANLVGRLQALNHPAAGEAARSLPHDVARTLKKGASEYRHIAREQLAESRAPLARLSRAAGITAEEAGRAVGNPLESAIRTVPGLRAVPVGGAIIAAIATVDDIRNRHVDPATAVTANVGSLVVATAAGEAVTSAVAGAAVGAAAEAAGVAGTAVVAVAAAPVEAVVLGVAAAVGTGYLVYKAVESEPGQHIVGGLAHGDMHRVGEGVSEIGSGIAALGSNATSFARYLLGAEAPKGH